MNKKREKADKPQFVPYQGPFYGLSLTDPMGSYTGVPLVPDEIPVQDADDL